MPDCNWCGGVEVAGPNGCPDHYACKNGADPCKTAPCSPQSPCKTGETCDPQGLCWPLTCDTTGECLVSNGGDCFCLWHCSDGALYEMDCKPAAGGIQCDCRKDKVSIVGCAAPGSSMCSPPGCCPFPI